MYVCERRMCVCEREMEGFGLEEMDGGKISKLQGLYNKES